MTLLFIDSFDHYDDNHYDEKGYFRFFSPNWQHVVGGGRRGTNAMTGEGNGVIGSYLEQEFDPTDTMVVGCAIQINSVPSQDKHLIHIADTADGKHEFNVTSAGELQIKSGGTTVNTVPSAYEPSSYNYYELKYTKGTGADAVLELRKDQVLVLTITNSSGTTQPNRARFLDAGNFFNPRLDDLYILNGEGTMNNDYLGDIRVDCQFASANGAQNDFFPNTVGANWTMLDDAIPDDDTTYVENGTILSRDLYKVDDATLGTDIYAIQQVIYSRKNDAGTITVDMLTEKGDGTGEQISVNVVPVDDWAFQLSLQETDPTTSNVWTDADINDTEWGYKIKTKI